MSKYAQITDLLQNLAHFRKQIEFLFKKRNSTVTVEEFNEYFEDEGSILEQMKILNFVFVENNRYVLLNQNIEEFLEKLTDISEDINNEYIRGKLQILKDNMSFYEKADFSKKLRYLEKIRKVIRDLRRDLNYNALQLHKLVQETYEPEPNFALKKKRLEVYKRKLGELMQLKKEFSDYFDSQEWLPFQKKANDEYLNYLLEQLNYTFADVEDLFIEINQKIIDYHNWYREQTKFVKKLKRLKEIKDKFNSLAELTDFEIVVRNDKTFFLSVQKLPTILDLDLLETDEVQEKINKLRNKYKNKLKPKKKQVSDNIVDVDSVHERKIEYVNYPALWRKFEAQGNTTFDFIFYNEEVSLISKDEKISIYVKFISLYFSQLENIGYKKYDEYLIANFKQKQR